MIEVEGGRFKVKGLGQVMVPQSKGLAAGLGLGKEYTPGPRG